MRMTWELLADEDRTRVGISPEHHMVGLTSSPAQLEMLLDQHETAPSQGGSVPVPLTGGGIDETGHGSGDLGDRAGLGSSRVLTAIS
jgi:hypothetical protein